VRHAVDEATSDYDREALRERAARMSGGVALIKVGASTEMEMKEKKSRVEDALVTGPFGVTPLPAGPGRAELAALGPTARSSLKALG